MAVADKYKVAKKYKKHRKGAVPIPYIIALILGIAVVALLSYWIYSTFSQGTGVEKSTKYNSLKVSYYTEWSRLGYRASPVLTTWDATTCGSSPSQNDCSMTMGSGACTNTGSSCSSDSECCTKSCPSCTPASCGSGCTDGGVSCSGATCTRTCSGTGCSATTCTKTCAG